MQGFLECFAGEVVDVCVWWVLAAEVEAVDICKL